MFEDSLVDSGGRLKTKSKYWMIATFGLNLCILIVMIILPLVHPEALPKTAMTAMLTAPPPPPPPPPPPAPAQVVKPIKMASEIDEGLHAPTKIPKKIQMIKEDSAPPPQVAGVVGMAGMTGGSAGGVLGGIPGGMGSSPAPVVKATPAPEKPKGPARISGGVIAGTIIEKTTPVYPPIAKAAHVSGAVVLHAIIGKNGAIQNLTVISGPEMLRASALDAVKGWRYKPYILNGDPTEVDTTITVNFNFGS